MHFVLGKHCIVAKFKPSIKILGTNVRKHCLTSVHQFFEFVGQITHLLLSEHPLCSV